MVNTRSFEKSALTRMVVQQARTLNKPHSLVDYLFPLAGDVAELALEYGLATASVLRRMVWHSVPVASDDLIVVGGVIGVVVACLSSGDIPYLLLDVFDQAEQVSFILFLCSGTVSCEQILFL